MATGKTAPTAKTTTTPKEPATIKKSVKSAAKTAAKPAAPKPAKATPAPAANKATKIKKVRDSFSMPENEYLEIARIKALCKKAGLPVKKSEVLRAGLKSLSRLNIAQIKRLLAGL